MRLFRRRAEEPYRFAALATYNAERSRGILHTDEWVERMEEEQRLFNFLHGIGAYGPRDSGARNTGSDPK